MATNSKKLTEDEIATLKKNARLVLSQVRRDILDKYPFIGSIALRMDMIPVRDVRIRTACTDGDNVYFDIAFLSSLSDAERKFVLAHEIWHAVLMHLVRRHNRIPTLFNIATDKEVNYLLKQDGFIPPPNLCWPEGEEVGKCAEEIYEMMLKKLPKQKGGGGKDKNKSKDDGSDGSGSGNKQGKLSGQFDKHVYEGESDDGDQPNGNEGGGETSGSEKISDKYGDVGFDPDFKPHVSKQFSDRMRETIISEAQRVEKMKGSVPAHVKELITRVMTPEIKWQEVLAQFVTRCYNSGNRTWIPPNRRYIHDGIYLPSQQASKIKIATVIDTSGSTMGDRSKFLGELNGLIKSFGRFDLHLIHCDADVQHYDHFTQDDNFNIEVDGYELAGGGGTAMKPALDYIIDNGLEVDAIIVLTDGYIDSIPKNPTGLPTLWIITKDGTEDFCDWGQKIKLKQDDADLGE